MIVYEAVAVGEPAVGHETSEICWFAPHEIPWDTIAFDSTEGALRAWVAKQGA